MNTRPGCSHDSQNAVNLHVFGEKDVVQSYVSERPCLLPSEAAILDRIKHEIQGGRILDMGVGGGRTTSALLKISREYTGMDYSGAMVETCRKLYPETRFLQCDARRMEALGREAFDFTLFSFNGIDYVNHADRQVVLDQVYGLLRPGGWFLFSSHNLRTPPNKPWCRKVYAAGWHPKTIMRNCCECVRNSLHYLRHVRSQVTGQGYGVLIDEAHHFQLLTYYVDPAEQVRQLEERGFQQVMVFDRYGNPRVLNDPALSQAIHVHYLASKPRNL